VADAGDNLALLSHRADQPNHRLAATHMIRRIPSGYDEDIEVVGGDVAGGLFALSRGAELAGGVLTCLGTDERYFATGLAQAINRVPHFHFLIQLFDQYTSALALKFHGCLLVRRTIPHHRSPLRKQRPRLRVGLRCTYSRTVLL